MLTPEQNSQIPPEIAENLPSLTGGSDIEYARAQRRAKNAAKNAARLRRAAETQIPDDYGPAMMALTSRQRQFVVSYVMFTACDATAAARMAGYSDKDPSSDFKSGIRVEGHRLLHSPKVSAAIREFALSCAGAEAPIYLKKLAHIAKNDAHRDQIKALGMMLNRVGIPESIDRNINVNITVTTEQKVAEIRQMAAELGLDPAALLGNVSDAEFEDVSIENAAEKDLA